MNTYNSVYDIKDNIIENSTLLTGFRPSTTQWSLESIWLTLWHIEQLKKVKYIKEKWCKNIFIIIADIQGFSDKSNHSHANLVKEITKDYAKGIISYLWEDTIVFRESKMRKEISHLTDILQDYTYVEDLSALLSESSWSFFDSRIRYNSKKGRVNNISNLITAYTGQMAHIIWSSANLVPSGADEFSRTFLAGKVIQRINQEYDTDYPIPNAIWTEEMILGIDWRQMSTNYWNYISTNDNKKEIEKKINMMNQKTLLYYYKKFHTGESKLALTEALYEIINPLQKPYDNNIIENVLNNSERKYTQKITNIIQTISPF